MFSILDIKPLSVNEGYTGRRWKTERHRAWQKSVLFLLPKFQLPEPPYELYIRFAFSSELSDFDNSTKFFVDCLSVKYRFNDKLIRRAVIETEIVAKGKEFIQWELKTLEINLLL